MDYHHQDKPDDYFIKNFHYPNGLPRLVADTVVDILENATSVASQRLYLHPKYSFRVCINHSYVYLADPYPVADWYRLFMEKRSLDILPIKLASFSKDWVMTREKIWSIIVKISNQIRFDKDSCMTGLLDEAIQFQNWVWIEHFYFMIIGLIAFEIRHHCLKKSNNINLINEATKKHKPRTLTPIEKKLLLGAIQGLHSGILRITNTKTISCNSSHYQYSDWLDSLKKENYYFGLRLDAALDVSEECWFENEDKVIARVKGLLSEYLAGRVSTENLSDISDSRDSSHKELDAMLELFKELDFPHWKEEHGPFMDLTASVPLRALLVRISNKVNDHRITPKLISYASLQELKECAYLIDRNKKIPEEWISNWFQYQLQHVNYTKNPPPQFMGTPKPFYNPILRYIHGYDELQSFNQRGKSILVGEPSSEGIASGPIKYVVSTDDLQTISDGDIIICDSFLPAWRLMIPKIAGCISARGGLLSHTSILCREMKIPCIICCGQQVWELSEGDIVEIDGYSGNINYKQKK